MTTKKTTIRKKKMTSSPSSSSTSSIGGASSSASSSSGAATNTVKQTKAEKLIAGLESQKAAIRTELSSLKAERKAIDKQINQLESFLAALTGKKKTGGIRAKRLTSEQKEAKLNEIHNILNEADSDGFPLPYIAKQVGLPDNQVRPLLQKLVKENNAKTKGKSRGMTYCKA